MADRPNSTNAPTLLTDAKVASIKAPAEGRDEYRDLKVTGLRLRVGTKDTKTWIIRARVGDKIINRKIGKYPAMGVATARTQAEKTLQALARDGSTEGLDRTFGELATTWIDKVAKPKNSSWKLQERRLEMHVFPEWRDRRVTEIRRKDVHDLIDGIEGDNLPNRVLAIIKTVFRFALSRDWIEASPVEGVKPPKPDAMRDRYLEMDEVARVWKAAAIMGHPFGSYLHLLILTGQRRTEVAAMKWDAVALDKGTWKLTADETKSKRAHLVPLAPAARDILKALPRFGPFVFSTDGSTHIKGYSKIKTRLDAFIADDGGDVMKPWAFHDFRRTASTHMGRLGVLMEVIGRTLNHAAQGVTAKVYALHQYEPEKRSALDRWAAEVQRAVTGAGNGKVVKLRSGK